MNIVHAFNARTAATMRIPVVQEAPAVLQGNAKIPVPRPHTTMFRASCGPEAFAIGGLLEVFRSCVFSVGPSPFCSFAGIVVSMLGRQMPHAPTRHRTRIAPPHK
mmetsp:Transcript_36549/g.64940  ORF Transcript_36549/g.64940 Transcript_36549/m.64940 type:complete len:105 (-) Transcript_36549:23-337(-)